MNGTRRTNIRMTAITLLFLVIITATALYNTAVAWTNDIQLTVTPADDDMKPSVVQTRDGMLLVFWASDTFEGQHDIFYKTSSDNGTSWSDARRFTRDLAADTAPSATQTRDGTIWVFWASYRTGNYDIFYKKISTDGGLKWSWDCFQFTYHSCDDSCPSVTQNLDGTIFVVWYRALAGDDYRLFYRTSSDAGILWSDEMSLTVNSWEVGPSVTWTYNGTLWVVWTHYNLTEHHYDLVYKTTPDNGLSWSATRRLTTDASFDVSPSVLQAPDGKMWVFWCTNRVGGGKYGIYYKTSTDYGSTWSLDTLLTTTSGSEEDPKATFTKDRKIWVVWSSTRSGDDHDIYYTISDEIALVHDIALTDITTWGPRGYKHWVPRGTPMYINVTVENQGTFEENSYVSVYADNSVGDVHIDLGTQNAFLTAGANTTLTVVWNTSDTPYGTYYISANATIVPGEYDTADNILLHGAKIGGICVPIQLPHVNIFALLAPIASATLVIVALGIAAITFFKILMSLKLRWP